jgi:hypothetical protein
VKGKIKDKIKGVITDPYCAGLAIEACVENKPYILYILLSFFALILLT